MRDIYPLSSPPEIPWPGHVSRNENTSIIKKLMFAEPQVNYFIEPWKNIADSVAWIEINVYG